MHDDIRNFIIILTNNNTYTRNNRWFSAHRCKRQFKNGNRHCYSRRCIQQIYWKTFDCIFSRRFYVAHLICCCLFVDVSCQSKLAIIFPWNRHPKIKMTIYNCAEAFIHIYYSQAYRNICLFSFSHVRLNPPKKKSFALFSIVAPINLQCMCVLYSAH